MKRPYEETTTATERPVIAFYAHKGGVSKTTSLLSMLDCAIKAGKRTVVIDCDPQMNATSFLAERYPEQMPFDAIYTEMLAHYRLRRIPAYQLTEQERAQMKSYALDTRNVFDLLIGMEDNWTTYLSSRADKLGYVLTPHLRVISSHPQLGAYDEWMSREVYNYSTQPNFIRRLRFLCDFLLNHDHCDLILLDLSPSNGLFNQMVLASASFLVTALTGDKFSTLSLGVLDLLLEDVEKNVSSRLRTPLPKVLAILYTRYEVGDQTLMMNNLHYEMSLQHMAYANKVLDPKNSALEAHMAQKSVVLFVRDAPTLFTQLSHKALTIFSSDATDKENNLLEALRQEYLVLWRSINEVIHQ